MELVGQKLALPMRATGLVSVAPAEATVSKRRQAHYLALILVVWEGFLLTELLALWFHSGFSVTACGKQMALNQVKSMSL